MKNYKRFHRKEVMRDNCEMGKVKTNPEYSRQYRNERDFVTPSFSTERKKFLKERKRGKRKKEK